MKTTKKSGHGPSRQIARQHYLGRKPGIAEIDGPPSGAENDARDPFVWTGRALQAESSEWLVLRICIRPLRGADHSWPSWISARVRSHSEIGPRRPVGSPDHERDGETVFHFSNPTCRPRRVSPTTKWSSRIDWSHPFGATVARSPRLASDGGGEGWRSSLW